MFNIIMRLLNSVPSVIIIQSPRQLPTTEFPLWGSSYLSEVRLNFIGYTISLMNEIITMILSSNIILIFVLDEKEQSSPPALSYRFVLFKGSVTPEAH